MALKNILFVCMILNSSYLFSQKVTTIPFRTLKTFFQQSNDTTYIVNFFASWCAPCVKELPDFVRFAEERKSEKIRLLLVSVDFQKDYRKALQPIMEKLHVAQPVFQLQDANDPDWISEIDPTWSGGIPATLFINSHQKYARLFAEPLTFDLLSQTLRSILQ